MKSFITQHQAGYSGQKLLAVTLAAGLLLGLTACKTNRQVTKASYNEPSGFLGDYSLMHKGTNGQAALVYFNPSADWAKYTKIWIKPIELWKSGDPDSPMGKISPDNQQKLVDLFNTSLNNALCTNYTMVTAGGPDVLVIHAAITDAKKSKPVAGVICGIYMPLKLVSLGKQGLAGTGIGVGSVTIEAELLDGQSNERLVSVVDTRSGTSFIGGRFAGTWGDVEKSFDWWAARLDTRLQEEKAGAAQKTAL